MKSLGQRVAVFYISVVVSIGVSCSVVSDSLQPHRLLPARLLCPWNFSGKNTGVGSCSLLQGIFSTQEPNPGLLHCRQILYHLNHQRIRAAKLFPEKVMPSVDSGPCVNVGSPSFNEMCGVGAWSVCGSVVV